MRIHNNIGPEPQRFPLPVIKEDPATSPPGVHPGAYRTSYIPLHPRERWAGEDHSLVTDATWCENVGYT